MATTLQYALLAGDSYYDTRSAINRFPVPQNWTIVSRVPEDGSTGFEASTYKNNFTNDIVISYAGTDGNGGSVLTNPDKQADARLGTENRQKTGDRPRFPSCSRVRSTPSC